METLEETTHDAILTLCPNCDNPWLFTHVVEHGKGIREKTCQCGQPAVTCIISWQWLYR